MGCIPYEKTARYLVPKWQSEHPEGLAKDCAKDLNISLTLVYDFWTSKKKRKSSKEIHDCVYEVIGMTYDIIDYSKLNKWVKVYDEDVPYNDERNYFVAFEKYSDAMRFSEDIEDGTYDYCLWQKADNDLSNNEIIAKVLFDDKDCSVVAKFEYGTPEVETMTSNEFDEMFEKRLYKLIENERSGQSM